MKLECPLEKNCEHCKWLWDDPFVEENEYTESECALVSIARNLAYLNWKEKEGKDG